MTATTIRSGIHRADTITAGVEAPVSTALLAAPPRPAAAFELGDLGSKQQLVRICGNGVEWTFGQRSLFILKGYESFSGTLIEIPASSFTTAVVSGLTSTTFTITYTLGGSSVVVHGSLDPATGALDLWRDWTLDHAALPTVGEWAFEWHYAFAPQGVAAKSQMRARIPAYGGLTYLDATGVEAGPPTADYPGFHGSGIFPQGTSGVTAGDQLCAVWDLASRACASIRTKATGGEGTRYAYTGDGDNVVIIVTEFPANNMATFSSSSAFHVELRPCRGDWFDACAWYLERLQAETAPCLSRGKLAAMSGASGHVSTSRLEADVMIIMAPGNAHSPTYLTNVAGDWTRCVTEITRIRADLGTDLKYIAQWYNWHANGNDSWPDIFPPLSQFLVSVASVAALSGVTQIVYCVPPALDPTSAYAAAHTEIAGMVVLTPAQQVVVIGSFGQTAHVYAQFGISALRTLLLAKWGDLVSQITNLGGCYVDLMSGNGTGGDWAAALSDANKGPGAAFGNGGKKTFLAAWRTQFKGSVAQWMTLGEWADEHMLPVIDSQGCAVSIYPTDPNEGSQWVILPGYSTIFSEYVPRFNYADAFGPFEASNIVDYDLILWMIERQFHQGSLVGFQYNGFTAKLPIVAQASDGHADYASIFTIYQRPALDFLKVLARSLTTQSIRKYHRGRRLRPLPGSPDDLLVRHGYVIEAAAVVEGGVVGPVLRESEVQSSVWASDELDSIGIVLTNRRDEDATFDVVLSPELCPELAAYRTLVQNEGGMRTTIRTFFGALRYTATVPARSLVLLELTP